jgi:hypothetical protein
VKPRAFFERQARIQHALLVQRLADDLKSNRQASAVQAAGTDIAGKARRARRGR